MTDRRSTAPRADLDRLLVLAESLAAAWAARAAASTTVGRERAILRAFGVGGLDRAGRPLAWAVVDRWLAADPGRLAAGIARPFALSMLEYDQGAQEVALDIASGAIDLGLEIPLLEDAGRRASADALVAERVATANERIDANRTARAELLDVLGDAPRPLLATPLDAERLRDATAEARARVRAGSDAVRVEVPIGRELALRRAAETDQRPLAASDAARGGVGRSGFGRPEDRGADADEQDDLDDAPPGSQRALAVLRGALDELGAERRAYVRLATAAPALSTAEHAVVAAFERVDVVEADPIADIVESGVDPDRSLADHAFAHRLLARGGAGMCIGAGPLVVGPDLARGEVPSTAVLAGRALALQVLGVRFALASGMEAASTLVCALPPFVATGPDAAARALAESAVRRALYPDHALTFFEPPRDSTDGDRSTDAWPWIVAAALTEAGPTAVVLRRPSTASTGGAAIGHRSAAEVASAVAGARGRHGLEGLEGLAAEHASIAIAEAVRTLERLHDEGWRAILGEPYDLRPAPPPHDRAVERAEGSGPLV